MHFRKLYSSRLSYSIATGISGMIGGFIAVGLFLLLTPETVGMQDYTVLVSGLIGAFAGSVISATATLTAAKNQAQYQRNFEEENLIGLLKVLEQDVKYLESKKSLDIFYNKETGILDQNRDQESNLANEISIYCMYIGLIENKIAHCKSAYFEHISIDVYQELCIAERALSRLGHSLDRSTFRKSEIRNISEHIERAMSYHNKSK